MIKALKSKKGFTLVEVIVVLIILAILAAVLVPTMTGYIDKANEKVVISEARAVFMAAQVIASEKYAKDSSVDKTYMDGAVAEVAKLAEVAGTVSDFVVTKNAITGFTYNNGKYTFKMADGDFAGATIATVTP